MKTTNKFGVPEALVRFLERDTYTRGASRISVTQLINSPRIVLLKAKHDQDIEVDVADQLWLLLGKAIHHVIEHGTRNTDKTTTEERLHAVVDGWRISGQMDLQEEDGGVVVTDWKFTSVWAVKYGKEDWVRQLNCYRWLAERNGKKVKRLQVVGFLRDWNRRDADKDGYPKAPIVIVPIPMWTAEEAEAYVKGRVRLHQEATAEMEFGEEPPLCTDEDRWIRESKWAVFSQGAERPRRMFDTEREAKEFVNGSNVLNIVERKGQPTRCMEFCDAAPWCSQWKADNERRNRA